MTGISPTPMQAQSQKEKAVQPPVPGTPQPAGYYSNQVITRRNGGVQHQFINDVGGCSANYR